MRSVYRGARRYRGSLPFAWAGGRAWFSVALGGAGIFLIDLVRLYSALSNAGEVAQLRYRPNDPAEPGTPIFGSLAAWYVNDILAEAPAPPGVLPAEVRRGRRLAFKTGTSYGYLWLPCFWAVGYDWEVTIGCGRGAPTGRRFRAAAAGMTAAPIMFKIADLRGPSPPRNDAPPPPGAILVGQQNLPPRLQRLDPRPLARITSQTTGLTVRIRAKPKPPSKTRAKATDAR